MKKIFLIIAVIFAMVNSLKAQNDTDYGRYIDSSNDTLNHRDYESQYLLPEPFLNNCVSLDVYNYFHTHPTPTQTLTTPITSRNIQTLYSCASVNSDELIDYAQPYYSDTIVKIIGISTIGLQEACGQTPNPEYCFSESDTIIYLEIRDSSLTNTYASYSTELSQIHYHYYPESNHWSWLYDIPAYTELIFNEPIFIRGYFNTVIHFADHPHLGMREYSIIFAVKNECPTTQPLPLRKRSNQNFWEEIAYEYYPTPKKAQALFLFPILGEIEESDTSSSSLNEIYGLNDFVTISPNPADKQTTIESKYQIKTIEIYNSLGQSIETKEVNNYSYSMDVSKYNSGHYIIKTITTNGTVNKKLIVK